MIKERCHDGFHEFHMTLKKTWPKWKEHQLSIHTFYICN